MPNNIRTLNEVTSADIAEVRKAIQRVGSGPTQIAGMSRRFNIVESDMAALVTAITTVGPKPKPKATVVTESAPQPRHERILYEAAQNLLDGADRAEADLTQASISDLEAYATLGIGARAFAR
jgi:hypothetical protein